MIPFKFFKNKTAKICVVGLGYVGLPLAVALAKYFQVIGFDVKQQRIDDLKIFLDRTREIKPAALKKIKIAYTANPTAINEAKFIIVAVPTPIDKENRPDLSLVEKATEMVGKNLTKDSVVVYESTVYPGVTEEVCVAILEKNSGLKAGVDFKVGYSPERINPGDKEHTIDKVVKVVAGMDDESLELIAQIYGAITKIFKAKSIKVAEAAKVIENTQRDLNIALMNELSVIFSKMNISTYDVLAAAGTKWNFLNFTPGLVGGHCIGVDPYYLTHKAQTLGYEPEVILSGRRINDSMPKFVVDQVLAKMKELGKETAKSSFVLCGITFKENIPDSRNSKAAVIYSELKKQNIAPVVFDPVADEQEVAREYGIKLAAENFAKADVMIIAVAHDISKNLFIKKLSNYLNAGALVVDIKHILNKNDVEKLGFNYWTL